MLSQEDNELITNTNPDTPMGALFRRFWEDDLTDLYHAARRLVFAECPRVEVTTKPGETYLVHRLTLHGMAPWSGETGHVASRTIIYFRPPFADPADWLSRP